MAWVDIARNNLLAAKRMCKAHPRSAISRAYYAAHVLLTDALVGLGYRAVAPYETAPHRQQANLIGLHFAARDVQFVADLSQAISRLYLRRLDADYSQFAALTATEAKDAIRDSVQIFALLNVEVQA